VVRAFGDGAFDTVRTKFQQHVLTGCTMSIHVSVAFICAAQGPYASFVMTCRESDSVFVFDTTTCTARRQ